MSNTNDFLPFADDPSANVESQAAYLTDTQRTLGQQSGVARSNINNKAIRQSSIITSQIAQIASDTLAQDVLDNGSPSTIYAQLAAVFKNAAPILPTTQQFLTAGSGTYNKSYTFTVVSANASIGATYTNGGNTYTVSATIASSTTLVATGNAAPPSSGTLTKASGTGDSTIAFTSVAAPIYIQVMAVGGGAGGSGSNGGSANAGNGGNTTFGTTLLVANGGTASTDSISSAIGGTASVGSGVSPIRIVGGGYGGAGSQDSQGSGNNHPAGANGGSSFYGGNGAGGSQGSGGTGLPGIANTGGGGGGGAGALTDYSGAGGGAGGYAEGFIYSPLASYSYTVGAGGTAGTSTQSNGSVGGTGAITVIEYYQ